MLLYILYGILAWMVMIYLRSKNHSSQSLLFPEPIMYWGRNTAQEPNTSAMYFSTPTWLASGLTTSYEISKDFRVQTKDSSREKDCEHRNGIIDYPFNMRRLVGWLIDPGAADVQELLHTGALGPIYNRPICVKTQKLEPIRASLRGVDIAISTAIPKTQATLQSTWWGKNCSQK